MELMMPVTQIWPWHSNSEKSHVLADHVYVLEMKIECRQRFKCDILGVLLIYWYKTCWPVILDTLRTIAPEDSIVSDFGEMGGNLAQSYDKNPYTHRTILKATWKHKNVTKTSIAQRLRID